MLVVQWVASVREERPLAWLWLEPDDNDPARFWMYVIEALRSVLPRVGEASLAMLRAPGVTVVEERSEALDLGFLAGGCTRHGVVWKIGHPMRVRHRSWSGVSAKSVR